MLQGYARRPVPSILDIQRVGRCSSTTSICIGEPCAHHPSLTFHQTGVKYRDPTLVGSKQWIGTQEVGMILNEWYKVCAFDLPGQAPGIALPHTFVSSTIFKDEVDIGNSVIPQIAGGDMILQGEFSCVCKS